MKLLIAADLHIGANKFGTTNEKWARPLAELVDYAIEHSVDAVAFAGDMFHHRRPTTWASQFVANELIRLVQGGVQVLGADGNHDDGVSADSVSASWFLNSPFECWARKVPDSWAIGNVNIVLLPWVTPQAYRAPSDWLLASQLDWAQSEALEAIKKLMQPDAVNILIGHAMVAYGPGADDLAPSPGLQWAGKDVVFDFNTLSKGFDAVYLGHVHDPRMEGYVGSSQPTDWGDAGQEKSFIRLVIPDAGGPPGWQAIPYKTSLKLLDVSDNRVDVGLIPDEDFVLSGWMESHKSSEPDPHFDVGRYRMHLKAGVDEPTPEKLAGIRAKMERLCDRVESIEVTKERTVVARVTTDTPLAAMPPADAVDAWLRHAGTDAKTAKAVREKFAEMVATK